MFNTFKLGYMYLTHLSLRLLKMYVADMWLTLHRTFALYRGIYGSIIDHVLKYLKTIYTDI